MELHFGGQVYPVSQLGLGFLILSPAVDLPPGVGEVMLRVDSIERRFPVQLEHGASSQQSKTVACNPAPRPASSPTAA
jgi:hypothetical protein